MTWRLILIIQTESSIYRPFAERRRLGDGREKIRPLDDAVFRHFPLAVALPRTRRGGR